MNPKTKRIILFLSAPPDIATSELREVLASHRDAQLTVYVREAHRSHYDAQLAECFVHSDKPTVDKRAFIRELRGHFYDESIVLDFGQWSFYPARCLFFLSRAAKKTVRTERGALPFSLFRPLVLLRHLIYRSKNRTGSVAGLPPGTPFPFVLAAYRLTFGLVLGVAWSLVEYGWRRLAVKRY